jgi:hypothetical protein
MVAVLRVGKPRHILKRHIIPRCMHYTTLYNQALGF